MLAAQIHVYNCTNLFKLHFFVELHVKKPLSDINERADTA